MLERGQSLYKHEVSREKKSKKILIQDNLCNTNGQVQRDDDDYDFTVQDSSPVLPPSPWEPSPTPIHGFKTDRHNRLFLGITFPFPFLSILVSQNFSLILFERITLMVFHENLNYKQKYKIETCLW